MGLYDNLTCKFPLPIKGINEFEFQTKDTDAQFLDNYEIREDGTLWHELYDVEDCSDAAKWQAANPGKEVPEELKGWSSFAGCRSRINQRWEQVKPFTREIVFYTSFGDGQKGWIEFSAYFENGMVSKINFIEYRNDRSSQTI
jgi:hypothetical protein